MILTQLQPENHPPKPLLCPSGWGSRPPLAQADTLISVLQRSDPFLADLRRASCLLQASIKEFEKGGPPGGAQVSRSMGWGSHATPQILQTGLSEGDSQGGHDHPCFPFSHVTNIYWVLTACTQGPSLGQADLCLPSWGLWYSGRGRC